MNKTKIWIDTDIGDDIDDAFALCLAMNSPEVEIMGVSTVFCNVEKRAKIAKALLVSGGYKNVPVYAGSCKPLVQTIMNNRPIDLCKFPNSYSEEFDNIVYDGDDAVTKMAEMIDVNEGMVLVTLGALTNIAVLIKKYPDVVKKLSFISIMGGAYGMNFHEFNFSCDPEAADLVLAYNVNKRLVGLDVTFQCHPTNEQRRKMSESEKPSVKLLLSLARHWGGGVYFHDPLALMCSFNKEYVKFEPRAVRIETEGNYTRGYAVTLSDYTFKEDSGKYKEEVAIEVKAEEFTSECVKRILA